MDFKTIWFNSLLPKSTTPSVCKQTNYGAWQRDGMATLSLLITGTMRENFTGRRGIPSIKTSTMVLWCCSRQAIERTSELPAVWDCMMLVWCNRKEIILISRCHNAENITQNTKGPFLLFTSWYVSGNSNFSLKLRDYRAKTKICIFIHCRITFVSIYETTMCVCLSALGRYLGKTERRTKTTTSTTTTTALSASTFLLNGW